MPEPSAHALLLALLGQVPDLSSVEIADLAARWNRVLLLRRGEFLVPPGQVEAARTLGLSPYRTFRHVVLKPALAAVYPSLTSQFILILLASSIVSTVSVPELTATANDIQGLTFRSLEAYLVVAAVYVGLTGIFKAVFMAIGQRSFAFRRPAY